jgi:hypothetical protein
MFIKAQGVAGQHGCLALRVSEDVRFGSKADMCSAQADVC